MSGYSHLIPAQAADDSRRRFPLRRRRDSPWKTSAGFSTAAAIQLRNDLSGDDPRRLARVGRDAKQVRRLLALAVVLDGGMRTEAARLGGVGLQIVRDWVPRINAEGPAGLVDRKAPTLSAEQCAALARAVEAGPEPWRDGGGALAADRPRAVAPGGVPGVGDRGDGGAGASGRSAFATTCARLHRASRSPRARFASWDRNPGRVRRWSRELSTRSGTEVADWGGFEPPTP